jgi:hypothetical protein
VHLIDVHLLGIHLLGVCLLQVCISYRRAFPGVPFTGVHLTGVYLTGVRLLSRASLTSMYLAGGEDGSDIYMSPARAITRLASATPPKLWALYGGLAPKL